jgi:outer membrane cobalamin receptor
MGKILSVTMGVMLLVAAAACADDVAAEEVEVFPGDPIVITAIGEPARESEVPFGIRAITAEDLKLLAADNLAEGLVRAEGIYVRGYGGAGAIKTVAVRGAFENQTLVMVDGQPVNNHQGGDVDFNAVALEDVERVEVMAGASSALYGANATAGVVNVITRGVPEEPRLSLRGGYGTNEKVDAAFAAGAISSSRTPWARRPPFRSAANIRRRSLASRVSFLPLRRSHARRTISQVLTPASTAR